MEGKERQLLLSPHLGARLRKLVAVGDRRKEGRRRVRGRAGSDISQREGRGEAGPPAARGLHRPVGGLQLQLEQRRPVEREGKGGVCGLRRLQALERLHAAPADRKRPDQPLEDVLPPHDVPRGAAGAVVRQLEPALALRRLPAMSPKSQTQLVSTGSTGHGPGLQTG